MVVKPPRLAPPGSPRARRRAVIAATLAGMGLWPRRIWATPPPFPVPRPPLPAPARSVAKPAPPAPIPAGPPGLGQIAAAHGRAFGAAIQSDLLATDPAFAASVTNERGLLMPDYEAKWSTLQAVEGRLTSPTWTL